MIMPKRFGSSFETQGRRRIMFALIKDSLSLYKRNILRILLIGITVILPIQVIYTILVNYVSLPFIYFNIPIWPSIFQSVFMIISIFVMIIPLISMVIQDTRFNKVKIGKLYLDMLRYAFFVYIISIPISIFTTAGFFLLIIPGLVLLIFTMGIPLVKMIEDDSFKGIMKKSIAFGKENFISLCGLLLLFAAVDFIGTYLFSYLSIVLTGQMAVTNWSLMILNLFLLPLFVFTISKQYMEWNGEAELLREDDYLLQLKQYQ
jgi:hypothetical protein